MMYNIYRERGLQKTIFNYHSALKTHHFYKNYYHNVEGSTGL